MGCVSSSLFNGEDEFGKLGSSALGHHIVSLTSSTYGLLNLDCPATPSYSPAAESDYEATTTTPPSLQVLCSRGIPDEVINSWELMSGLDAESFRLSPIVASKDPNFKFDEENVNPNLTQNGVPFQPKHSTSQFELSNPVGIPSETGKKLEEFQSICPPNGETKMVIYTTTLRGIRKTFEDCNRVRLMVEGFGVAICERDVSMDKRFKDELRQLMKKDAIALPKVFLKGKYIGGFEELSRIVEEGWMEELLKDLPKKKAWQPCEGCGDVRFVPCFSCNGSCKLVSDDEQNLRGRTRAEVVIRCPDCNENGLVFCPLCH